MHFKNEISSWDDFRIFQYVAEAGGLAIAAKKTGISAPTLGRHILRLEQELNIKLFDKQQSGYYLTETGKELLHYTSLMRETYGAINRWKDNFSQGLTVKISAGGWTALFLTSQLKKAMKSSGDLKIELVTDVGYVDLLRREANIGIRNKPSKQPGLKSIKLNTVNFAVYANSSLSIPSVTENNISQLAKFNWIGSSLQTPSTKWIKDNINPNFVFTSSNVHLLLDAIEAGIGLCILPCFIGDTKSSLTRVTPHISALSHNQWLVHHCEDLHFSAINLTVNNLIKIWNSNKSSFTTHD